MKIPATLLTALMLSLLAMPAIAQSLKTDLEKCAYNAACVKKVHKQSEASTNALYRTVLSNQGGAQQKRLKIGHQQFLKYRKSFCDFSARQSGKLNMTNLQVCQTRLNIQYAMLLEDFLISP